MARFTKGWIKLHREVAESDIGSDFMALGIFTALLLRATRYETTINWQGSPRRIPAGSVLIGFRELAESINVSVKILRKWLLYFSKRDSIYLESGTRGTLVTFRKWEEYQIEDYESGTPRAHRGHTEGTPRENGGILNGELEKEECIIAPNKPSALLGAVPPFAGDPELEKLLARVSHTAQERWIKLYQDPEFLRRQFLRMAEWLEANPRRAPKKSPTLFIANWLAKEWERFRKTLATQPAAQINLTPIDLGGRK